MDEDEAVAPEEDIDRIQWLDESDDDQPTLDYRGRDTSDSVDGELPAAWETELSPWSVGYEPIGATSIGVEAERKKSSQFARFKVPETRLALHQEGRHPSDGNQASRLANIDKKRITQAYCSQLDIPRHLQAEAVRGMLLLDLTAFGNRKRIEGIALLVIEVIVDYERRYRRRDEEADRLAEDPTFKYLSRAAGLVPGKMKLGQKVKTELIERGFFEPGAPGLKSGADENARDAGQVGAFADITTKERGNRDTISLRAAASMEQGEWWQIQQDEDTEAG
ncbi:hypothetical protein [Haloglomus litoreum]|uniref:hypothetical protein n=1 Tax=Haloglomus litoreum TaxID=3034026 RepID=UPI0023E7F9FE|nr:hypothetical protein [Haloglomus sp. DT116]